MKLLAQYKSHKNGITYACVAIGQNYLHDVWEQTPQGYVKTPQVVQCSADEVVLLEICRWGRPQVFKTADIEFAITNGTITLLT